MESVKVPSTIAYVPVMADSLPEERETECLCGMGGVSTDDRKGGGGSMIGNGRVSGGPRTPPGQTQSQNSCCG